MPSQYFVYRGGESSERSFSPETARCQAADAASEVTTD